MWPGIDLSECCSCGKTKNARLLDKGRAFCYVEMRNGLLSASDKVDDEENAENDKRGIDLFPLHGASFDDDVA